MNSTPPSSSICVDVYHNVNEIYFERDILIRARLDSMEYAFERYILIHAWLDYDYDSKILIHRLSMCWYYI